MDRALKNLPFYFYFSIGLSILVIIISFLTFYKSIELRLLDARFRIRGPIPTRTDIATVDIDVRALQTEGRFQDWTRDKHARIIQFAGDQGVRMLAFDIYFPEQSLAHIPAAALKGLDSTGLTMTSLRDLIKDDDEIMSSAMRSAGNVYLAQSFKPLEKGDKTEIKPRSESQDRSLELLAPYYRHVDLKSFKTLFSFSDIEPPIEKFILNSKAIGFAQVKADEDGTIRRYPLVGYYDGRLFPSIVLLMVCDYLNVSFQDVQVIPGETVVIPRPGGEPLNIPISKEGFMMVNWAGDWTEDFIHYPYILAAEFSEQNKENVILDILKNMLIENPELIKSPSEVVAQIVEQGIGSRDQGRDAYTKIMMAQRVESALETNPDLKAAKFFQAQGLPANRVPPGMIQFFDIIKSNGIMEKALVENIDVEYDSLIIPHGLEKESASHWNFTIIQNYLDAGGNRESLRPLYFVPPRTRFSLQGKTIAPYEFKDKMLFYGLTATGTHDLNPMPYNARYPMVGLHANALNTILSEKFIRRIPHFVEALIILGIALLVGFVNSRFHPLAGGGITTVMWGAAALVNLFLFIKLGLWVDFLGPSVVFLFSYIGITIYNFMNEEKDKKFLHDTFKAYLSPELIDQMYAEKQIPALGGDEGFRTAFFTDIQSFSTIAETLGNPTKLVELLNEYLTAMTDILLAHKGTLDKYEGDAIIAMFGAPMSLEDHAERACVTAIDMQNTLKSLREKWQTEGDKWPEIVNTMQMRIGINSGPIVTGNMGSKTRMNYTMIGDAVNIAARLENIGKQYGVYTIISGETKSNVANGKLETRLIDRIRVIGKQEPVEMYELLGGVGQVSPKVLELKSGFQQGMEFYMAQDWTKAKSCFLEVSELEFARDSYSKKITPSQIFIQRCESYIQNPVGPDWDGVYTATSK